MFDLMSFVPLEAEPTRIGTPSFSIVNTEDHGKRLKLSSGALKALGNPDSINCSIHDGVLAIGTALPNALANFKVGKHGNIYNAELVKAITKEFQLDFDVHTSFSFKSFETMTLENGSVVLFFKH